MINRGTEIRDSRVGSLINFCDCAAEIQFVHITKHAARTRLQFEHTQRLRDDADQLTIGEYRLTKFSLMLAAIEEQYRKRSRDEKNQGIAR